MTTNSTTNAASKVTQEICVQCESNARWNEAGGYKELAEACREYCRQGHKEKAGD